MKIEELDKNFKQQAEGADGLIYLKPIGAPFSLHGLFYGEGGYFRMPQRIADGVSAGVAALNRHTAGGRIRFSTDSAKIAVMAEWKSLDRMPHMPLSGSSGFVLLEETGGQIRYVATFMPDWTEEKGFLRTAALGSGGMREYILYFPLYNDVTELYIGLESGASLERGRAYKDAAPVVYYGSSITRGGCASRADNSYQALVAKRLGMDFVNLGFSGNAHAEDAMTDYLASLDCSAMVFDYDHNAPCAAELEATHFRMYERYRAGRPETPLLLVSRPDFERDGESAARLAIVRGTYERASAAGDENVYFLDGRELFAKEDRVNCTVDGTHPNDLGFYRMAQAIGGALERILTKKRR